ncbi:hypothetical protein A2961_03160 [Candidatus Woesebacteria bacterium RIFCSPLOWO2_01_FULL_39_21]|uniref:Tr-type G domain-containing protein n=1 Tax=Candidatus Woesebacteria bacterium RIFCSPLOWO2_01_FULL_39_21 TaxID=1802519 RepID=A0A1F8BH98_9BACT|nr:MAG: hypothetical protein A2691_02610 [Candidatus Woesebacteria bacterium RIFCSPHIGHO2_01_FULL_39_23]OGM63437.1 MAG: hypothetical protein A2961_03160 [Candidatus Woesebacteria bacterium RIFCSPLOWO2_01_FULL_39_21]
MKRPRPPIVTVLGHVDHGKTTLLDYIRKTSLAKKEAGGITQNIGASVITTQKGLPQGVGKEITFIDTPGHAAFSNMRSRGVKLADIAILVVASDAGVKPQTEEALNYITEVNAPFIVALTKVDLPSAEIEKVKGELEKLGVLFEGRGGNVPLIAVSAKTGQGVNELLETISLMADVGEISGDDKASLEAVVIETLKDNRGVLVSVVVKNGLLRVSDTVFCTDIKAKVRGLFNFQGKSVREVFPGFPCQILGFSHLPEVGSLITTEATKVEKKQLDTFTEGTLNEGLPMIIKADNSGSLEAVVSNLPSGVHVVSKGVGDVNEGDIFLAKTSKANIFTFEAKANSSVRKLGETEGVKIFEFKIIYELFEALEKLIEEGIEKILGKARISASFPYERKKVAGCKVLEGKISKASKLRLFRDDNALGNVRVISLKKGKLDVDEVGQGEEFGVIFEPQLEFKPGDVLLSVQ